MDQVTDKIPCKVQVKNPKDQNCDFLVMFYKDEKHAMGFANVLNKAKQWVRQCFPQKAWELLKDVAFYPRFKKGDLFLEIEGLVQNGIDIEQVNLNLKKEFAKSPEETMLNFFGSPTSLIRLNIAFLVDCEELLSFVVKDNLKITTSELTTTETPKATTTSKEDIAFIFLQLKKYTEPETHDFLFAFVNFSPFELLTIISTREFYLPCFFFATSQSNLKSSTEYNTTIKIDLRASKQIFSQLRTNRVGDKVLFLPFTLFEFQSFEKPLGVLEVKLKNLSFETSHCQGNNFISKIVNQTFNKLPGGCFLKSNNLEENIEFLNRAEQIVNEDIDIQNIIFSQEMSIFL